MAGERRAHRVGRRAEIDRESEPPQHRAEPLGEFDGNAVDEERLRSERERPLPASAQ